MRKPSSFLQLYAWHTAAVSGREPPTHDGIPQCGWYKTKLTKDGPWVPARIFIERDICPNTNELLGPETIGFEVDGLRADDPEGRWTWLTPITQAEFEHLTDYRLRSPHMADAKGKVDLSSTPTLPQGYFHA